MVVQVVSYEECFSDGKLHPIDTLSQHPGSKEIYYKGFLLNTSEEFEVDRRLLKRVDTGVEAKLFEYQKDVVVKMIRRRRCFCCLTMGLGKTLSAIAACSAFVLKDKYDVVICPAYLRNNWLDEFEKWYPDANVTLIKTKKQIEDVAPGGFTIVSYEMAAALFAHVMPENINTVVCDESHYLKNAKSKRWKDLSCTLKATPQLFLLTGTPVPNRPCELFAQLSLLHPYIFNNYYVFCKRYCDGKMGPFGYDDRGVSNVEELSFLMSKVAIRLRREDVLEDLPDYTRDKVLLERKKDRDFEKRFTDFTMLIRSEKPNSFKLNSLISELFRMTSDLKKDVVIKYLMDEIIPEEKTIVFCKHIAFAKHLSDTLEDKWKTILVTGEVDMSKRASLLSTFLNSTDVNIAVLTLGSCSTGLNLVPVTKMIFAELDWSPSTLLQAECRINRIGAAKELEYLYLLCENSLDTYVYNKAFKKAELASHIVDDGKDYGDMQEISKRQKTQE